MSSFNREHPKVFSVTVDYVNSATLRVSALSEEQAEEIVEKYLQTEKGQREMMLRFMLNPNMPDGFDIAFTEEGRTPLADLYESEWR